MIPHEQTKNGCHYWAITKENDDWNTKEILVVLKVRERYEVCGPWECGIESGYIEIIEEIVKPSGYEQHILYYDNQ